MHIFQFLLDLYAETVEQLETIYQQQQQQHTQVLSKLAEATDSHQVAAVALEMVGATRATAYQVLPNVKPRTVRNITCRMCMSLEVETSEQEHMASEKVAVLHDIQQAAEKAKVRPNIAMAAVTRYLNSPERVLTVLTDLHTLQVENCKVWNPTGLFTRLMRNGGDVKLPDRVIQRRTQQAEAAAEKAAKPVPAPGVLVKLYGEVCEILEVTRQFALVRTKLDDIKVSLDSLRYYTPSPSTG